MNILEVKNLTKKFGGLVAVNSLSFSIKKGTINALIGPNGSGKTTVLNLITGFLKPDRGEIIWNGKNISGLSPYKIASSGIARTFQNIRIFPQMTVLENLLVTVENKKDETIFKALFNRNHCFESEKDLKNKIINDYLKYFNLADEKNELANEINSLAYTLSYGQRKLLELARVIATGAELLLLDEPFSGVFPEVRIKICKLLKDIKNNGKTIVFIEHDIKTVSEISDNIIVLNYGEKIAEGSPEIVLSNEKVIEAYLGKRYVA